MEVIDLEQLLVGTTFTASCSLTFNDKVMISISTLPDSEANGFALLDTGAAKAASCYFQEQKNTLPKPVMVKGNNGKPGFTIQEMIILDLVLDNRKLAKITF